MSMFKKASREKLKARIALDGPSGSGKTYTGLRFAFALAGSGGKVAVIDTEHRSASKYQGESPDGVPWDFDVCELTHYAPTTYTQVLREAGAQGYDAVLVDSLSHAWEGVGGALDQIDKKGGNSFTAWKDVTPQHREMIEAILACPCHVIVTMRTKMEYVLEEQTNKQGKSTMVPKKIGMAPIQRQGMEYEFDIVCDLDHSHTLTVSKSRCPAIDSRKVVNPSPAFLTPVISWLDKGSAPVRTDEAEPIVFGQPSTPSSTQPSTSAKPGGVKMNGKSKGDNTHEQSVKEPCGDEIANQIKGFAKTLDMPPQKLAEIVKRYGVERVADIPFREADQLRRSLEKMTLEQKAPF